MQGILQLGRQTLAVGEGPQGGGLYSLTDANGDGVMEEARRIVAFTGSTGEHGPHAIRLGPDGFIYVAVGNFAGVEGVLGLDAARRVGGDPRLNLASAGPYFPFYEGDLFQPRYEDPRGHAVGVQAPGGDDHSHGCPRETRGTVCGRISQRVRLCIHLSR